jgi:uncharacterized phage protein (TIGR01671 family)
MINNTKYRGKRIDNGEWVYGSLYFNGKDKYWILPYGYDPNPEPPEYPALECGVEDRGLQKDGYGAAFYGFDNAVSRYTDNIPLWIEVIPESVGQFTGLHDKNGKEIYAGDICKYLYCPDEFVTISWDNVLLTFKGTIISEGIVCEDIFFINSDSDKIEVIGSIYENTELVEGL